MKFIDNIIAFWKPIEVSDDLIQLESKLGTLAYIEPNPEFTQKLRKRLMLKFSTRDSLFINPQHQTLKAGLLVTGGVIGSILVLLTGVRGFLSLLGIGGLLLSWFRQNSQDNLLSIDSMQ